MISQRQAGIPEDLLVEAHGSFASASCIECSAPYTKEWVKSHVFSSTIPHCEKCSGVVKPDITFFGEDLPARYKELFRSDMAAASLLFVIGTSLEVCCPSASLQWPDVGAAQVYPVAQLPSLVHHLCPRVLINLQEVWLASGPSDDTDGADDDDDASGTTDARFRFRFDDNYRDVFVQSTCEKAADEIARLLGLEEELDELIVESSGKGAHLLSVTCGRQEFSHCSLPVRRAIGSGNCFGIAAAGRIQRELRWFSSCNSRCCGSEDHSRGAV